MTSNDFCFACKWVMKPHDYVRNVFFKNNLRTMSLFLFYFFKIVDVG